MDKFEISFAYAAMIALKTDGNKNILQNNFEKASVMLNFEVVQLFGGVNVRY